MSQTQAVTAKRWHLSHVLRKVDGETPLVLKPGKRSKNSQAQRGPRFPGFGVGRGFAIWGPFPVQAPDSAPETWTSLNKNLALHTALPVVDGFGGFAGFGGFVFITPARKFRMLLHINPTRQRGKRTGSLAGASGWYMTFFAAGVIPTATLASRTNARRLCA